MTENPQPSLDLELGGVRVAVTDLEHFVEADPRRGTSFISNFGTWHLAPPANVAMRSLQAHLEWSHDTGELFLIGALPIMGISELDVPPSLATAASLGAIGGGESVLVSRREVSPGLVREFFPAETVPVGTAVAVLAVIEHGWTAHEVLWGWHMRQHDPDGWQWLVHRLEAHRTASTEERGAAPNAVIQPCPPVDGPAAVDDHDDDGLPGVFGGRGR